VKTLYEILPLQRDRAQVKNNEILSIQDRMAG